jgi:hypothetical protein
MYRRKARRKEERKKVLVRLFRATISNRPREPAHARDEVINQGNAKSHLSVGLREKDGDKWIPFPVDQGLLEINSNVPTGVPVIITFQLGTNNQPAEFLIELEEDSSTAGGGLWVEHGWLALMKERSVLACRGYYYYYIEFRAGDN